MQSEPQTGEIIIRDINIMKFKKLIILTCLLLLIFGVATVSAEENTTDGGSDEININDVNGYNARIIAKDISEEYDPYAGNNMIFSIEDLNGNPIEDAKPTVTYDNKKVDAILDGEHDFSKKSGTYFLDRDPDVGNHKVKIQLNTSKYRAEPVSFNVKISKIATKLTLKKYVTTTNEYVILKAIVKDKYGDEICEGKVKFKVGGKTYSVKVKDGVATKKIRLNKAKTYTYTAKFTGPFYKTKTASSKLYIKKTKKYYTLKITNPKIQRTFKVQLPYKQYVKVLNAKNKGKYGYACIDTGIKRPPEWGGGHYNVGISTKDKYFTYYDYELGDYLFLRASSYLCIKKINLYTANF